VVEVAIEYGDGMSERRAERGDTTPWMINLMMSEQMDLRESQHTVMARLVGFV
jgi:hypothetical protein